VLYSNNESETACNPFINSLARTCFKLNGAHGRSSFNAADTPAVTKEMPMQMDNGFRMGDGNAA
jgi:hypothetical protein